MTRNSRRCYYTSGSRRSFSAAWTPTRAASRAAPFLARCTPGNPRSPSAEQAALAPCL
eukprot:CAMPEP_0198549492 /NCGR_PEP_ID=MMETSP1462-20131121/72924_1 /TAXON_ID=1333877 /ORGANISM="Brandtodinium nutriculum, Strain RCC3387" /LENGTH=57 /DNA_ID=CAMNT_0044280073 /DNA_START=145 /DNA_END=315 /DNA_ORIENTATION=-